MADDIPNSASELDDPAYPSSLTRYETRRQAFFKTITAGVPPETKNLQAENGKTFENARQAVETEFGDKKSNKEEYIDELVQKGKLKRDRLVHLRKRKILRSLTVISSRRISKNGNQTGMTLTAN